MLSESYYGRIRRNRLDRLVLAASPKHLYAAPLYAEYDAATSTLQYVNAGHNAPFVLRWRPGQCEAFQLDSCGTALGLLEGSRFASKVFQLEKGDVFVAYTDKITESENLSGELWGQARLETLVRACSDCTPTQMVGRILNEVFAFAKAVLKRTT